MFWTIRVALLLLAATNVRAESVSYFRHDGGLADSDTKPLPAEVDPDRNLLWRQPLAPGNSTPCLFGDRIFVTTYAADKKQLATVALDRSSGKICWTQVVPTEKIEPFHPVGSPAASTPACDGRRVYTFFGSFGLLCYDLDGKLLWSKPMGPFRDEYGAASSPILVDNLVVLNEDHDVDSFLIAIDRATGKTVWKVGRKGFTRSYATPVVCTVGGEKQIVVAGPLQLIAYAAEDGRKLWWVNGLSRIIDTSPTVANGLVYVATWSPGGDPADRIRMEPFPDAAARYDRDGDGRIARTELPQGAVLSRFFRMDLNQDGGLDADEWATYAQVFQRAQNVAMAVRPGGSGDVTDTHVQWICRRGLPTVPSPLVYRGMVYMIKEGGIVTSLDATTGRIVKQGRAPGRGNYYASPVAGDGKVYIASERGVVGVLKAGGRWERISQHDFGARILATPVLCDGRIYLRTDAALYRFGSR